MKRERYSRNKDKELYAKLDKSFDVRDMRYWGLFDTNKKGKKLKIDPKRFQKALRFKFDENQLKIINNRRTHYFLPKKIYWADYNCNVFEGEIDDIKKYWSNHFKELITREVDRIKKPQKLMPGDYYNLQCGISGTGAAQVWANWKNMKNKQTYMNECYFLISGLYAQFIHYMTSRIEAIMVKVLTRNNALKDRFDRNAFYATCIGKEKKMEQMENFVYYDKLYCIWNFIKHNSLSTFKTLNDRYPELVYCADKYQQGDLAIYFLKFSNELIDDLLNGIEKFFMEYCKIVFDEDYDEAQWNYSAYFIKQADDEIESITNPLGLEWWDDLD